LREQLRCFGVAGAPTFSARLTTRCGSAVPQRRVRWRRACGSVGALNALTPSLDAPGSFSARNGGSRTFCGWARSLPPRFYSVAGYTAMHAVVRRFCLRACLFLPATCLHATAAMLLRAAHLRRTTAALRAAAPRTSPATLPSPACAAALPRANMPSPRLHCKHAAAGAFPRGAAASCVPLCCADLCAADSRYAPSVLACGIWARVLRPHFLPCPYIVLTSPYHLLPHHHWQARSTALLSGAALACAMQALLANTFPAFPGLASCGTSVEHRGKTIPTLLSAWTTTADVACRPVKKLGVKGPAFVAPSFHRRPPYIPLLRGRLFCLSAFLYLPTGVICRAYVPLPSHSCLQRLLLWRWRRRRLQDS